MYYEINIALNGKHLFATHKRSITDSETFLKVFAILNKNFQKKKGTAYLLHITLNIQGKPHVPQC